MEGSTSEVSADASSSSEANPAIAMKHLAGVCLKEIGGSGFISDVYNDFVSRFGATKSGRLYSWMNERLRHSDFVTVSEKNEHGRKSRSILFTLDEFKFTAFLRELGVYRSVERCWQIVNTSLTCGRHAIMMPARKRVLEIPPSEFITMLIDCLKNECGGVASLAPIVAAVAARLNLPAEDMGVRSPIYRRVKQFLNGSGRFQSTGVGHKHTWMVLGRPKSQEQKWSQARKRVMDIPPNEFIAMMIDCLENECGGTASLGSIVAAVAARLNLPTENSGQNSIIYHRIRQLLGRSGRFQSTGAGPTRTWTVLGKSKGRERKQSQPTAADALLRTQKRVLDIPPGELITTMIDCLENECGGTAFLPSVVAAVAARLNLSADHSGLHSTIYSRVRYYLRQSGRFRRTGAGRKHAWAVLARSKSQEQSRPVADDDDDDDVVLRTQKQVLGIPSNEFITMMVDCLTNECGGTATQISIVGAVAARLKLSAEHASQTSTIYYRVGGFLRRSGRFQSTGAGRKRTWTVLEGPPKRQEPKWSQSAVNAFLRRVRRRELKIAAAERQKRQRQREIAELEQRVKELEDGSKQNASYTVEGLSDAEITFSPETGCLVISMESGRVRQLVGTSNSVKMAISTVNGFPVIGARPLDNDSTFRLERSSDHKQIRLEVSQQNDTDEPLGA